MLLKGSCYCRAVRFSIESETPSYAINIMGQAETLRVKGRTRIYKARPPWGERHFCGKCASALWVWDKRWPQWVYPFASAIDTPLPVPRERQYIFLSSKPNWVEVPKRGKRFREFPREAIVDWHRSRRLLVP